jgi:tetratricopeptide (TPR) repeat protein
MNRIARILFMPALPSLLLFLSLVETPSFAQAPPHQPSQMNLWQARRAIAALLGDADVRFSPDGFEYDWKYKKGSAWASETIKIDLVTAPAVAAKCGSDCSLKLTYDAGSLPKNKATSSFLNQRPNWNCDAPPMTSSADCVHAAESFAAGFNALRAFARDPDAPMRTFTQRAVAWHALATKPPIPEEVNVQRLMAEDAIKENKPDEALNYYEDGIELFPTWPEGNFNAALIAAELKYYVYAIEHMQAYLELVPNAADAQAAHEKILIWQVKSKQ